MATYSRLTRQQRSDWHERSMRAHEKYGIRYNDYAALCDYEHILHTWAERECNGEIERDEPSDRWPLGRPRRFAETMRGERLDLGYVPDYAAAAMRKIVRRLSAYKGLAVYWQTDPRGCQVYIYRPTDCYGRDISTCYNSVAYPCFY